MMNKRGLFSLAVVVAVVASACEDTLDCCHPIPPPPIPIPLETPVPDMTGTWHVLHWIGAGGADDVTIRYSLTEQGDAITGDLYWSVRDSDVAAGFVATGQVSGKRFNEGNREGAHLDAEVVVVTTAYPEHVIESTVSYRGLMEHGESLDGSFSFAGGETEVVIDDHDVVHVRMVPHAVRVFLERDGS